MAGGRHSPAAVHPAQAVGLGFALVVRFSAELALTMVSAGVTAALSVRHVASHWSRFGGFGRKAPYGSAALVVLCTGRLGWEGLHHPAATQVNSVSSLAG